MKCLADTATFSFSEELNKVIDWRMPVKGLEDPHYSKNVSCIRDGCKIIQETDSSDILNARDSS